MHTRVVCVCARARGVCVHARGVRVRARVVCVGGCVCNILVCGCWFPKQSSAGLTPVDLSEKAPRIFFKRGRRERV